jgi:two-component system response regulator HydG
MIASPHRVLLVDDNVPFARLLQAALQEHGHACAVAHTARAGIDAVRSNTFDVVIADVHLGHASGLDVLRGVQALHPATRRILISASLPSVDEVELELAHAYMLKPFDASALLEMVEVSGLVA